MRKERERKSDGERKEWRKRFILFYLRMYFKVINVFKINIYITGCQCQMVSNLQLLSDHMLVFIVS